MFISKLLIISLLVLVITQFAVGRNIFYFVCGYDGITYKIGKMAYNAKQVRKHNFQTSSFLIHSLNNTKKNTLYVLALNSIPYARHHKPLLIRSRSWIQAIHKDIIFWKNLLKNKKMVFGNGVKNIQAAAYNGARTVSNLDKSLSST